MLFYPLKFYLAKIFYLDLRSLALFRIGLGIISLYNLFSLYPNIDDFFGQHGVAPLSLATSNLNFSFHAISDNTFFLHILFLLHALFSIMLLLGFHSRLASILCWIMTISLINRLPIIVYGADRALHVFLMWGAFLPLGARFSLDAYFSRSKLPAPNKIVSMATIAFFCQILMIYAFNAIGKNNPAWNLDYNALYYILNSHTFAKPLGIWLVQFPDFLKCLTLLTFLLETYGGFLLFSPVLPTLCRSIVIIIFITFHLCIHITLDVGWFSIIMIIIWTALIPSRWWQNTHHFSKENSSTTIAFNKINSVVVAMLLIFIFVINYRFVDINILHSGSKETIIEDFAKNAGLYQKWYVFPFSSRVNREYFYSPIYADTLDREHPPISKPIRIERSDRWIDLLEKVNRNEFSDFKFYLSTYFTYHWNMNPQNQKIKSVHIFYKDEPIP